MCPRGNWMCEFGEKLGLEIEIMPVIYMMVNVFKDS